MTDILSPPLLYLLPIPCSVSFCSTLSYPHWSYILPTPYTYSLLSTSLLSISLLSSLFTFRSWYLSLHPYSHPSFSPSFPPKVLVSPHAVVADGGALCHSGNLMVATAAKVRTYEHILSTLIIIDFNIYQSLSLWNTNLFNTYDYCLS